MLARNDSDARRVTLSERLSKATCTIAVVPSEGIELLQCPAGLPLPVVPISLRLSTAAIEPVPTSPALRSAARADAANGRCWCAR